MHSTALEVIFKENKTLWKHIFRKHQTCSFLKLLGVAGLVAHSFVTDLNGSSNLKHFLSCFQIIHFGKISVVAQFAILEIFDSV